MISLLTMSISYNECKEIVDLKDSDSKVIIEDQKEADKKATSNTESDEKKPTLNIKQPSATEATKQKNTIEVVDVISEFERKTVIEESKKEELPVDIKANTEGPKIWEDSGKNQKPSVDSIRNALRS